MWTRELWKIISCVVAYWVCAKITQIQAVVCAVIWRFSVKQPLLFGPFHSKQLCCSVSTHSDRNSPYFLHEWFKRSRSHFMCYCVSPMQQARHNSFCRVFLSLFTTEVVEMLWASTSLYHHWLLTPVCTGVLYETCFGLLKLFSFPLFLFTYLIWIYLKSDYHFILIFAEGFCSFISWR